MPIRDWFRRRPAAGPPEVVMYTRQGCHLCEVAWGQLEVARRRYGFTLRTEDVDAVPEWVEQYGNCVPVVVVDGKVRFRGRVNEVLLERLLEHTARPPEFGTSSPACTPIIPLP